MEMAADAPDADRCNAITRDGSRCRKYPVGGAGDGRCRFHGGASTGPSDTSHLEGNDHAEGNPGGGAPEGNANAKIHGGFSDWRKAYERFDDETRAYVDRIAADFRDRAAEHAPDVDADRRAELCLEKATLMILGQRAGADAWCEPDDSGVGRGFVVEVEREEGGEARTVRRPNPAFRAEREASRRQREIAEELRLYPGLRGDE